MTGDLVARLASLAEHDRAALVGVLAVVHLEALRVALRFADTRDPGGVPKPGP